jgi:hypothetical protein
MIIKTHFLLKFHRIILEIILNRNVLSLNSFNIEKLVFVARKNFGGVVEINTEISITQYIADSVF